jgi:hypothetical protein
MSAMKAKDGRSARKAKGIAFIDNIVDDCVENLSTLVFRAKLVLEQIPGAVWDDSDWEIQGGRLLEQPGKNVISPTLSFRYAPKLGGKAIDGSFGQLAKALMTLRFVRASQALANQRIFVSAVSYIADACQSKQLENLTPSDLDNACGKASAHYSESAAYNVHKMVGEIAAYCDSNRLCKVRFDYRYGKMKRPDSTGGFTGRRLDDPKALDRDESKMASKELYEAIGNLFTNVPHNHPKRLPVLLLTVIACTGMRFAECASLPSNCIKHNQEGQVALRYFKGKASAGRTETSLEDKWLTKDMADIVVAAMGEVLTLTRDARSTAAEMRKVNGPDMRFLDLHFATSTRSDRVLNGRDLVALRLPPGAVFVWSKKGGWIKTFDGKIFVTEDGVAEYCRRKYAPQSILEKFIDTSRRPYYLEDMAFCVPVYINQSIERAHWLSTGFSHEMLNKFIERDLESLIRQFAPEVAVDIDFTSHAFRHTVNTLLDEGGLPELLQTRWFGRSNPRDTKAYQHTSKETRVLEVRQALLNGSAKGRIANDLKKIPITLREVYVEARVRAVHDVGPGACVHDFSQLPCERHLQCAADCRDYVWTEGDAGRVDEVKRQWAIAQVQQKTAEDTANSNRPRRSADWMAHNAKKISQLEDQLHSLKIEPFDPFEFLEKLVA